MVDVGCGEGALEFYLANKTRKPGPYIVMIDVDMKALKYAKYILGSKAIFDSICADATLIPLREGIIDLVIASEVIEHLKEYEDFMCEIFRILKAGGYMILTTPSKSREAPSDPFHFKEFSDIELQKLCKEFKTAFFGFIPLAAFNIHHYLCNFICKLSGHKRSLLRSALLRSLDLLLYLISRIIKFTNSSKGAHIMVICKKPTW